MSTFIVSITASLIMLLIAACSSVEDLSTDSNMQTNNAVHTSEKKSTIIGDDLTLQDVAYTEAEFIEFKNQLIRDKESLRKRFYELNDSFSNGNISFDFVFDQAVNFGQPEAGLLISEIYYEKAESTHFSSLNALRLAAFLKFGAALKKNSVDAQLSMGYYLGFPGMSLLDNQRCRYWLTLAANNGSGLAALLLAKKYKEDYKIAPYEQKFRLRDLSLNYYEQAATSGEDMVSAEASYELGHYFFFSNNEFSKGIKFLEKSALDGYGPAAGALAEIYLVGEIIPVDYKKARYWAQLGIDNNDATSYAIMGAIYQLDAGSNRDISKAIQYYRKSCDLGSDLGCQNYKIMKSDAGGYR